MKSFVRCGFSHDIETKYRDEDNGVWSIVFYQAPGGDDDYSQEIVVGTYAQAVSHMKSKGYNNSYVAKMPVTNLATESTQQPISKIVDGWFLRDGQLHLLVKHPDNVVHTTTLRLKLDNQRR